MTPISARVSEVSKANSKAALLASRLSRTSLALASLGNPFTGSTSMADLCITSKQGRSVLLCRPCNNPHTHASPSSLQR